jgi:hypothetical protein
MDGLQITSLYALTLALNFLGVIGSTWFSSLDGEWRG